MSQIDAIVGKAKKKHSAKGSKKKKRSTVDQSSKGRKNNKAFNVANIVSAKKTIQRNLDKAQQKEVVPLVNRIEAVPPPSMVVVMGPKGVGKTTFIRSLVKIYTGQNLTDSTGPITVVAGSKKRITFFECPLDLYAMTDLAKVADLIILMIDASYGLEMETFEFLNILQLHGFPKVIGVLTHLDRFRSMKSLQNTKKQLKHRFWTEIYKGAKMFDLMGVVNGKYRKHEIKRISLHISRLKFRPLVWRNTHPYLVVDRVEDVTPAVKKRSKINGFRDGDDEDDDQSADDAFFGEDGEKEVTLYGYVRGSHLKPSTKVHLIGAGDFDIHSITQLPDPCPLKHPDAQQLKLSRKKDHLLYAPMANVGRVSMDRDSLYIDLKHINYTKKDQLYLPDQEQVDDNDLVNNEGTPMDLLRSMQDVKVGLDQQLKKATSRGDLDLFANTPATVQHLRSNKDNFEDEYDREEEDDASGEDDDDNDDEDQSSNEDEEEYHVEDDEDEELNDDEIDDEDDYDPESHDSEYDEDEKDQNESDDDISFFKQQQAQRNSKEKGVAGSLLNNNFNDIMNDIYGDSWVHTSRQNQNKSDSNKGKNFNQEAVHDDFFQVKDVSFKSNRTSEYEMNRIDSSRYYYQSYQVIASHSPNASVFTALSLNEKLRRSIFNRNSKNYKIMKTRFVTGGWKNPISVSGAATSNDEDSEEVNFDDDEVVDGDFEDLEAQNEQSPDDEDDDNDNDDNDESDEEDEDGDDDDGESDEDESEDASDDDLDDEEVQEQMNEDIDRKLREMNAQKKAMFKAKFDEGYDKQKAGEGESDDDRHANLDMSDEEKVDEEIEEDDEEHTNLIEKAQRQFELQSERNKNEFGEEGELARQSYEGFRQGLYVRIHLKGVPVEFIKNFSSSRPIIIGGLLPSETSMGFINARVKRHRWHKKILKSNDPLIFSIGWRRFQSLPIYTMTDQNDRDRYLKYTPEHMHCTATFYGPLVAPNTGILAYQIVSNHVAGFRISLTGTALEQRATPEVVKKLKLVGTPVKIFKNTAFITGMFNSALEVAKFEHAKIKTVSGIRGSIKKAVHDKNDVAGVKNGAMNIGKLQPGTFRATFEDKILMSDIVICRLWVPVEIKKFYNPVLSLLSTTSTTAGNDNADPSAGLLMRSTAQLRKDMQIPQVVNKDSVYKPIQRQEREFSKLKIPTKLQESLPFASKPKNVKAKNPKSYLARRAVILEPEERKERGLIQMLSTIKKDKDSKRKTANKQRSAEKQKALAREKERFEDIHKEEKKRKYKEIGLDQQRKMRKLDR